MPKRRYASAFEMASRQRDIPVSEFFAKNRHLLGFDSPYKAILTAVKEAVDNALDACEEAGILPEIAVEIAEVREGIFRVMVQDDGPGIVEAQVGRIFGKLLYGSRFFGLSQSRGQQGMGIAAAGMYGHLTTGKPMRIRTRRRRARQAVEMLVSIDTTKNKPEVRRKKQVAWDVRHGTRVEIELEGRYRTGAHSVERYLTLSAIANPHATFHLTAPETPRLDLPRSVRSLPARPREIRPHPHGVELGRFIAMLKHSSERTLGSFLAREFSQVGSVKAREVIALAARDLSVRSRPRRLSRAQAGALHRALAHTPIAAPRTDCVVPIGEAQILAGLRREIDAGWYTAVTRPPAVYRGNPFVVEVGVAYGRPGDSNLGVDAKGRIVERAAPARGAHLLASEGSPATLLRFANRVPLLFQQSACAMTKAVIETHWKTYGIPQARGALPTAPMALFIHVASVWVPFTSESKEAVVGYDEIHKELVLALRQCARRLRDHTARRARLRREHARRTYIETFLPHIASALGDILDLDEPRRDAVVALLDDALVRSRKKALES
jgi:DNA topoisomerase-6 subunit B